MGSVLVHDCWAPSRQGNSVVTAAAQTKTKMYKDSTTSVRIRSVYNLQALSRKIQVY